MHATKGLLAAGILVLSGACATPPPAAVPPPLDIPAATDSAAGPVRDTRPSPRVPIGTTGIFRIRDFAAVAHEVGALMGLPPSFDVTVLLHSFVDPDVLAAVDMTAPMDGLNTDAPHRAAAAAFSMKADGENALRERFDLRPDGGLAYLVKKEPDRTGRGMRSCALHGGRIVCALDEETLAKCAPYLVTTLPAEPLDHAIRVIVPGTAVRDRKRDPQRAPEDRLATELVAGLERELDRVEVDLDLGATVEATLTLRLLSREAPLTRALAASGRVGPPPPALAQLPNDALLSLWSNGAAAEDLEPLKKAIASELQTTLETDGYVPAAAKASIDELAKLFLTGGPFVLAAGTTKSKWVVAAVDEPASRWTTGLRALVKKSDEAERTRNKVQSLARTRPDGDDIAARIAAVPASAKLPPDTLHVEIKLTPKKRGSGPVRIAHLWVVPQGDRTWIGYGEDDAAVRDRLRAAREGRVTTTSADDPEALAGARATTLGLVTLFAPEKLVPASGGNDPLTMSVVTDPKSLAVRMRGSRQAAIDLAKSFF